MNLSTDLNKAIEPAANQPLVTIAIPTFNRAHFLSLAIESVLAQTYKNIEIVISDNCSADNTASILASYQDCRLRHIKQKTNIGMVGNWNACLELAHGDFFLLLSDDDRLASNAIYDLVESITGATRGNPVVSPEEIAFAYGSCEVNYLKEKIKCISQKAPLFESSLDYRLNYLRSRRVSYPSATLFRTNDIRSLGGYSTRFGFTTDIGMTFEVSGRYNIVAFTGTVTSFYLFHPENITTSLSIEVLLDSTRELAKLSVSVLGASETKAREDTQKAGTWAQAATVSHQVAERYFSGSIGIGSALLMLWSCRKLFSNGECFILLVKAVIKLGLSCMFGWRAIPPN